MTKIKLSVAAKSQFSCLQTHVYSDLNLFELYSYASMIKCTKKALWCLKTFIFFSQMSKVVANCCLHYIFSWCPSIVVLSAQDRISRWNLQNSSMKIMPKSKWLNLVLDVNFTTLNILKLKFSCISLNPFKTWGHHQLFWVENHTFNEFYHVISKSKIVSCSISPLAPSSKICRF